MKKRILILLVVVLALAATASVVWAHGGSANGDDVCWMQGSTEVRATFYETRSGIIHQWRYSPQHLHLVFKPKARFPEEPDEGSWFSWPYTGQYDECDPLSDTILDEVFEIGSSYWVEITVQ